MPKEGRKFDQEKLRFNLVPQGVLEQVIKVLMKGAEKYDFDNWKNVKDWKRRYLEATKRHIADYEQGEQFDIGKDGDGLHHLAHAICDLMFLLWKELNRTIYIAGPMRGYAHHNFHEFFKWESILNHYGWNVINPARMSYEICVDLCKQLDEIAYKTYLEQDLKAIKEKCSSIFMLENWEYSEGAITEKKLAEDLGLKIYYEKDGVPEPAIGAIK